ncbi:MAG: AbrB/MazE/SpoVT family DNA-binding domain-containing protein [Candidatus Hadarchaeota archaeon]
MGILKEEISVVGERGQIVIPRKLRTKLGLKPKTKMLVAGRGDAVIMRKIDLEQERRKLEAVFKRVDERVKRYGGITEKEIFKLVHDYRNKGR